MGKKASLERLERELDQFSRPDRAVSVLEKDGIDGLASLLIELNRLRERMGEKVDSAVGDISEIERCRDGFLKASEVERDWISAYLHYLGLKEGGVDLGIEEVRTRLKPIARADLTLFYERMLEDSHVGLSPSSDESYVRLFDTFFQEDILDRDLRSRVSSIETARDMNRFARSAPLDDIDALAELSEEKGFDFARLLRGEAGAAIFDFIEAFRESEFWRLAYSLGIFSGNRVNTNALLEDFRSGGSRNTLIEKIELFLRRGNGLQAERNIRSNRRALGRPLARDFLERAKKVRDQEIFRRCVRYFLIEENDRALEDFYRLQSRGIAFDDIITQLALMTDGAIVEKLLSAEGPIGRVRQIKIRIADRLILGGISAI